MGVIEAGATACASSGPSDYLSACHPAALRCRPSGTWSSLRSIPLIDGLFRQAIEDVFRDPLHDLIAAAETVCPIRRAGREHGSPARVEAQDRGALRWLAGRGAREAVVPEGIGGMPARRARCQDHEAIRRAVAMGRHW